MLYRFGRELVLGALALTISAGGTAALAADCRAIDTQAGCSVAAGCTWVKGYTIAKGKHAGSTVKPYCRKKNSRVSKAAATPAAPAAASETAAKK